MKARTFKRNEFLSDIITTAVEGGTGYWAYSDGYKWSNTQPWLTRATLTESEPEGDEKPKTGELNMDTVAGALGRISRGEIKLRADLVKLIAGANATNDGGDIDAEGADVIAQVAILGDVIYG